MVYKEETDAEVQKIQVQIEQVKIKAPQALHGELDGILQAVQNLSGAYQENFKKIASQLPAEKQPAEKR